MIWSNSPVNYTGFLIVQQSFNQVSIKFFLKPCFTRIVSKKNRSTESKVFSISIVKRKDNLPNSTYLSSPKDQILIYPLHLKIYSLHIRYFWDQFNLTQTESKDIGLLSSFFRKTILNDSRRGILTWSQNPSYNSFVRPSFPGDLLISILFNLRLLLLLLYLFHKEYIDHQSISEGFYLVDIAIPSV